MSQYGFQPQNQPYGSQSSAQNLQFYSSSYSPAPVSGHATPSQAAYGYGAPVASAYGGGSSGGFNSGFGAPPVSGRMGEQGGLRTGWLAAFGTEGYDGEPPLLEELGVNFGHIQSKFGTFLLLSGKVHFGYIYGLALVGSCSLHLILSLMSPPLTPGDPNPHHDHPGRTSTADPGSAHLSSALTFPRSASVLGYCLLPLVLTSLVGIVVPMDGMLGYILTTMAISWCTYSASGMFCAVGRMSGMRGLVAYPLCLFYVGFGIMGIFSSRGSGSLGKVASSGI
ncbi:MAG: hypothetical protein M1818_000424 [Claussenomyces sp. TS43310]|nr:MAG: hypothetical protein M1818_000424 [Claussenomyces sp. TS43310]